MRPAQPPAGSRSATPIYDALYAEYRRSFRALPGDRSGEEELGFTSFTAGLYAARHHAPPRLYGMDSGRQSGLGAPLHAALPPAPRREH
ncbi:hypothetical protein GTW43_36660 [Streptomyces sp. SID5785]|uniref:hypothetical protein n=1 Tax=Streptomyces sp. SID5785 TaxID=2690309 RepID=UPI001361D5AE|nr:hypothetical protein [Streptomyces sp. SID5785]MZD10570.1 hypothetical protein [Streptomyces sp. SID5785]